MEIWPYLAMTGAEIGHAASLPGKMAWMACHFAAGGRGLSGLPETLPPGAVLIVNDRLPIADHDPERVAEELAGAIRRFRCRGVLLDLEREPTAKARAVVAAIAGVLGSRAIVASRYAQDLPCPVFLPPVPPDTKPEYYLQPWLGREIWLEVALDGLVITITREGAKLTALPHPAAFQEGFYEERLHCRYRAEVFDDRAKVTLRRTARGLPAFLEYLARLGVTETVGLWQELMQVTCHPEEPKGDEGSGCVI